MPDAIADKLTIPNLHQFLDPIPDIHLLLGIARRRAELDAAD